MKFFGKKKEKILDWSEGYKPSSRIPIKAVSSKSNDEDNSSLGFLGNLANSANSSSSDISWDNDSPATVGDYQDKKQKLAKRLLDMTNKIEDMSNEIYHLKQRIELLEKKLKINF